MDDPNITMEEYIRLEEEKARKSGKVFNWETAKYGKITIYLSPLTRPPPDIVDFKMRLARIYKREVHRVLVFDFGGLPDLMAEGLSARMLMEHRDAQGLGGARHRLSWRQFIVALGLHMGEEMESPAGYFLGTTLSYTSIRNLILRLCHRLIACSIAWRSQAPEKVIMTDLFYLRGMDVGSINVPYLLAIYLGLFAVGRKNIAPALPVIDMDELVRLQICIKIDDTWDWVALGPERQPDVAAGAPGVAQDASVVDEGDQAVSVPRQAHSHHQLAARTKPQCCQIIGGSALICRSLAKPREYLCYGQGFLQIHRSGRGLVRPAPPQPGSLINVLIFVGTFFVVMDFAVLEDMNAYRDKGICDVIFGEPFLREVGIKARRFEGIITIYNGSRERNINEYWWKVYKSGDLEVLES
ncbi:hypothetical protein Tco_0378731 [Tanacetum coccineum]